MLRKLLSSIVLTLMLASGSIPQSYAQTDSVIIFKASPCVLTKKNVIQHFAEYVNLIPGQEKLPLTMEIHNGNGATPGFYWVSIASPSMATVYLTAKDFPGGVHKLDVSGDFGEGTNQLIMAGTGAQGATLSWSLNTEPVQLSSISPENISSGDKVTLYGRNFSTDSSIDVVTINGQPAKVISATNEQIVAKVPSASKGGLSSVLVTVGGVPSGQLSVNIAAVPTLTGVSQPIAAPSQTVTISGTNFSANAGDNVAYVGPFQAQVQSATPTSLTITVPVNFADLFPQYYQPVVVLVNGVRARNKLLLSVSQVG